MDAAADAADAALLGTSHSTESAKQALAPFFSITIAFVVINSLVLALRLVAVLCARKARLRLSWDDWFLVASYPLVIGVCAIALVMYHVETHPNGKGDLPFTSLEVYGVLLKCALAMIEVLLSAMVMTRYSILALYLRLFTSPRVRLGSWILIGFYTAYWFSFMLFGLLQCRPLNYYWNQFLDPQARGTCIDIAFSHSVSIPNIVLDLFILILPLPTIWRLQISNIRRAGLTLVFLTGISAFAISIVRTVIIERKTDELADPELTNKTFLWMVLEPSLYFITASFPAMSPLLRLASPKRWRKRNPHGRALSTDLWPLATPSTDQSQKVSYLAEKPSFASFGRSHGVGISEVHRDISSSGGFGEDSGMLDGEAIRNIRAGHGIMIRTEISVEYTTEQRIETILDL